MIAHNPVEVTGNIIVHHPTQQQGDKK